MIMTLLPILWLVFKITRYNSYIYCEQTSPTSKIEFFGLQNCFLKPSFFTLRYPATTLIYTLWAKFYYQKIRVFWASKFFSDTLFLPRFPPKFFSGRIMSSICPWPPRWISASIGQPWGIFLVYAFLLDRHGAYSNYMCFGWIDMEYCWNSDSRA